MDFVFRVEGAASSQVDFIDCTTFDDSRISDAGSGTLRQFKSANYTALDEVG